MKKQRTEIPSKVAADVVFQQDHTCCVCRERGLAIQIHHMDDDPANNAIENLAVLCLQHHNETQISGGFGRQLAYLEVRRYCDDWIERVRKRRDDADRIAAERMAGPPRPDVLLTFQMLSAGDTTLRSYVADLPGRLKSARAEASLLWEIGATVALRAGTDQVIEVLEQIWVHLAAQYPESHFSGRDPREFISELVANRFAIHRLLVEPYGVGSGGSLVGVEIGGRVMQDLHQLVEETVGGLLADSPAFDLQRWSEEWNAALDGASDE